MIQSTYKGMKAALSESGFRVWRERLLEIEGRNGRADYRVIARRWPGGWTVQVKAGQGSSIMEAQSLPTLIHALTCTLAAVDALTSLPRTLVAEHD